jgi:hypothetical protein
MTVGSTCFFDPGAAGRISRLAGMETGNLGNCLRVASGIRHTECKRAANVAGGPPGLARKLHTRRNYGAREVRETKD